MSLYVRRKPNESWRDCVTRCAGKWGLEHECLSAFDKYMNEGMELGRAAFCALGDWDVLDYAEESAA